MNKHILTVAAAALLSIPTFSIAEDKPAGDKPAGDKPAAERPAGERRGRGDFSPEARVKMMTERLGLTEEQQGKLKEIYAKAAEENKALREKGRENLTEEDRTKMRESFKAQNEQVQALLTPEQKEKYKEMSQRRGGERRGGNRPDGEKKDN